MSSLRIHHAHPWDVNPKEAIAIQEALATFVQEVPLSVTPETVGGVDASIQGNDVRGAAAILRRHNLELILSATSTAPLTFPYIPGLLSFRELPAILKALEALPTLPDVILCDAHGKAHPRRLGLASHLGVLLDHPTVGCAKSRLIGTHPPLSPERGAWVPLVDGNEVIGAVVRTRSNVRPVYVSVGHRITLMEAVNLVLDTTSRYRIPEPLRIAHKLSRNPGQG